MRILLTGASGFFGKNCIPLLGKKHEVVSVGRKNDNAVVADITKQISKLPEVDIVIHAAGKAHVYPKTAEEIKEFFDVNVVGTTNLLESLQSQQLHGFVFISSVSVYGLEQGMDVTEDTPLHGKAPYALSKIQAETIVENWCRLHNIDFLILRLPLIVGRHPLGNLGKMMVAIQNKRYVRIAKGDAKKSMVLASDVADLISKWIDMPHRQSGIYNLTDGHHPSFFDLEEGLKNLLHVRYIPSVPRWLGTLLGKLGDHLKWFPVNSGAIRKITGTFTFSDKKARVELGWAPRRVLDHLNELL